MDSITLSYATAISSLQEENNISSEETIEALEKISNSFDKDIKKFLNSKAINSNDKKEIIQNSLKGFDKNIIGFICVLIDNNRINLLDDIILAYKQIKQEEDGKIIVNVKVSKSLTKEEKEKIKFSIKNKFFKENTNKVIEINEIIDKNILKGIVIEYQNKILDASLISKQESLKEFLEK